MEAIAAWTKAFELGAIDIHEVGCFLSAEPPSGSPCHNLP
jgi:hypothetical protein